MFTKSRESWARVGGVTAMSCLVAGFYFGLLKAMLPSPSGFLRNLVEIGGIGLVSVILSMAFVGPARKRYLGGVATVVVVLLVAACSLKFFLKGSLEHAFDAILYDINKLAPGPDPNEEWKQYWRNY